jgi:hypothetical protein
VDCSNDCYVADTDCNDCCAVGTDYSNGCFAVDMGCNIDNCYVVDIDDPDSNASLNFHYDVGVNQYEIHKDFQN